MVITDFVFIPDSPAYHNRYRLYDVEHHSELTDLLEINILELPV
ncbi:MAG: Rpn family recombination-promoting nuclease/putative transposase [Planctomycetaceae bacterium]|nr:Rpn family recombination-promoting nuclease/putative transposase [Planctomycetaceae bacterium]